MIDGENIERTKSKMKNKNDNDFYFTVINLLKRHRSIPHHSRANVAKPASIYNRA